MKTIILSASLFMLSLLTSVSTAQELSFTDAQVESGEALYDEFCVMCHGDNLENGRFGTPLKGFFFANRWKDRSLGELARYTWEEMPEGNGKYLNMDEYIALIAFILEANGLEPGDTAMSEDFAELDTITLPFE